jgi:hypothetical protein
VRAKSEKYLKNRFFVTSFCHKSEKNYTFALVINQHDVMKRLFVMVIMAAVVIGASAQENKYIVKTKGAKKTVVAASAEDPQAMQETTEPQDTLSRFFRYVSMCDWGTGMRFMVIPDKKDMVIKTFADAETGQMVSSTKLRHKIMVYQGHENTGGLHERVNFTCEDDGKAYYFEVPTASFDDYCFGKLGVPTLAYLGDVDAAIEFFKDKTLFTLAREYYVDTELDGDGYKTITDVKPGTEVKVVAVGVGTRNFPVKIIVADESGREFFQNVAISKTNSGMRDEEFDISNMKFHTFRGAFELPADNMAASSAYKKFIGREVYTKYASVFTDQNGKPTKAARLSTFKIMGVRVQRGTHYVMMTLRGLGSGKTYTKEVTFVSQDVSGDIAGTHEDLYDNLFAEGNPLNIPGVQKEHMVDIQKGLVRAGFTEAEVLLALGEPSGRGEIDGKTYTMVYKHIGQRYACVFLDKKTHKVKSVKH